VRAGVGTTEKNYGHHALTPESQSEF
jgi:hypothetical protein